MNLFFDTKQYFQKNSRLHDRRGFALLFAVLASSVFLSVGLAIWNISLRQVIFSSFGRESQIAFYAADTGIECVLYYDVKLGAFDPATRASSIDCGGVPATVSGAGEVSNISSIFLTGVSSGPCVDVTVTKNALAGKTTIDAHGHNTCDTGSPTLVERGLRVSY